MKLKWNRAAFRELRTNEPGVISDLRSRTNRVASRAGEGYKGNVIAGRSRARGGVVTATRRAIRDNARNNTLVKSMDAGR